MNLWSLLIKQKYFLNFITGYIKLFAKKLKKAILLREDKKNIEWDFEQISNLSRETYY